MAKIIALLLACFAAFGQTLSVINTGTTSNDGTGDSLRTAFTKANTNFYQLWSEVFTNIPVDIANASAGKLNATNGTAVNLTGSLTNVTVDAVAGRQLSGPVMQRASGLEYWAIGDSQTIGAMVITTNWAPAMSITAALRYPNISAATLDLNLTNLAFSGAGIPYDDSSAARRANGLAQANAIPGAWSGAVSVMLGYNDSFTWGKTTRAFWWFEQAQEALLARLFLTNWYSAAAGTDKNGTATPGWTTDGTVIDEGFAGVNPFPVGTVSTNTRSWLALTNAQAASVTLPTAGRWAVFIDRNATGGDVWVLTNGTPAVALDGYCSTYSFPSVAYVNVPTAGVTLTVTNVTGGNRLHAIGRILDASEATDRTVVLMSPVKLGNFAGSRVDEWGELIGRATESAAANFSEYNVGFANAAAVINADLHVPASDLNHLNPQGHAVLARALTNAVKVSTFGGGFQPQDPSVQTSYIFASGSMQPDRLARGTSLEFSGTSGKLTSYDWLNLDYEPLQIRAEVVEASEGGIFVSGNASGFPALAKTGIGIEYDSGSASGLITSADYSTVTYKPLILRSAVTEFRQGGFIVTGGAGGFVPLGATGVAVEYSTASSTGFITSYNYAGSSYKELDLRANPVRVSQSPGLKIGKSSGSRGIGIEPGQNQIGFIDFTTATTNRWRIEKTATTEAGANAGSNFRITRYSDAGASLGTAFEITRSSGLVTVNTLDVTSNLVFANATSTLAYSGTNVTHTPTSTLSGATLTLTNNCLLTITASDGYSGGITIVPNSSTSYTVYLDSAIKLLGGGSSFVVTNSASETVNLEWKQTKRGTSGVILANKAVYP